VQKVRTKLQKAIAGELEVAAENEDEEKFVTIEEEEEAISSSKYFVSLHPVVVIVGCLPAYCENRA
jgi:hypothetical protein